MIQFGIVDDTFRLDRIGVVVVARKADRSLEVSIGETLILVRPDESEAEVRIRGIEMTRPFNPDLEGLLFDELGPADVPAGTVLYKRLDS